MKVNARLKALITFGMLILFALTLASCATATPQATSQAPVQEPTQAASQEPVPTAVPPVELRVVELEWPATVKLGDSDVIRLALVPSDDGYTARAEYDEHTLTSQALEIKRPEGYTLSATARLDGTGFDISPAGDQRYIVPPEEAITWRWSLSPRTPGRQRVSLLLVLRWEPESGAQGVTKESLVFDRSLEIQVISFLGLRKPEALAFGFTGLAFGLLVGVLAWTGGRNRSGLHLATMNPDVNLAIEAASGMALNPDETRLMQALFHKYQRLILQREFMSGYSGARTFLARPVKNDTHSDAETIIKIGPRQDIVTEFQNYEAFVKDRLPPITARIQNPPITLRGSQRAALQYTCIAEPGKSPISLRQSLLAQPDPILIQRLFDSFGPYWWMQRQPYTFRMAQEYDRLLPPHLVLEPAAGLTGFALQPDYDPTMMQVRPGDLVNAAAFDRYELRADGKSLTLFGTQSPGRPVLRVRWLGVKPPSGTTARVVALRSDLLRQYTAGFDLLGLADPLTRLEAWLQEVVSGTRSVIHGDLNLENILVGPGNLVWLIDFAQTREGHSLFDFSRLASELIAHVLVEKCQTPQEYLNLLRSGGDPLLRTVENIATACLFDGKNPREYSQTLTLACLGALKYQNLPARAKYYLYLTAAFYGSNP